MAKQTFTTGQVLLASQLTDLQQTAMGGGAATAKTASYVLVAADAGTTIIMNAAGATTITVNTSLFAAGDTVNIQNIGAGICTVTAGTATVNTAGSLALNQYEGGVLYFRSTSAATFFDYVQTGSVSPLTTKGDLYTFSTLDARLGVGANGTVLTAASGEATGLSWATPTAPAYSGCAATNNADYTISNGVYTALTFNTERFDTDGYHDTSTNTSRFTVPAGKAGKYLFSGNISFDSNSTGVRAAYIYKNGSFIRNGSEMIMSGTASGVTCAFAHVIDLTVGDYLEARALQTSGGVLSVVMGNTGTTVEFTFLGA